MQFCIQLYNDIWKIIPYLTITVHIEKKQKDSYPHFSKIIE